MVLSPSRPGACCAIMAPTQTRQGRRCAFRAQWLQARARSALILLQSVRASLTEVGLSPSTRHVQRCEWISGTGSNPLAECGMLDLCTVDAAKGGNRSWAAMPTRWHSAPSLHHRAEMLSPAHPFDSCHFTLHFHTRAPPPRRLCVWPKLLRPAGC